MDKTHAHFSVYGLQWFIADKAMDVFMARFAKMTSAC